MKKISKKIISGVGVISLALLVTGCQSELENPEKSKQKEVTQVEETEPTVKESEKEYVKEAYLEHIHGLGYTPDGKELYIPSHFGFQIYSEGKWLKTDGTGHDYMGFNAVNDGFYSSGHPAAGSDLPNPLGLVKGSYNEEKIESLSLLGEVDFHSMAVGYNTHMIYVLNHGDNSKIKGSGLFYSADDGTSWEKSALEGLQGDIISFATHPDKANVLIVGTDKGVYYSENYGDNFAQLTKGLAVTSVLIENNGTLFIGGFTDKPVLLVSQNPKDGEFGQLGDLSLGEEDYITYMARNPKKEGELVIATANKNIYITTNQGSDWKQIVKEGNSN